MILRWRNSAKVTAGLKWPPVFCKRDNSYRHAAANQLLVRTVNTEQAIKGVKFDTFDIIYTSKEKVNKSSM